MTGKRRPAAPAGLGPRAARLWRDVVQAYELRPDEVRILEDIVREVDERVCHGVRREVGRGELGGRGVVVAPGRLRQQVLERAARALRRGEDTGGRALGSGDDRRRDGLAARGGVELAYGSRTVVQLAQAERLRQPLCRVDGEHHHGPSGLGGPERQRG